MFKINEKEIVLGIVFLLLIVNQLFGQEPIKSDQIVKIWEDSINIPAYLVDPPSLNPMFYDGRSYQGAQGRIYPYPLNQSLTNNQKNL